MLVLLEHEDARSLADNEACGRYVWANVRARTLVNPKPTRGAERNDESKQTKPSPSETPNKQTNKQTNERTNKQTNKQTNEKALRAEQRPRLQRGGLAREQPWTDAMEAQRRLAGLPRVCD